MKINKMLALVMVIAVLVSACAPAAAPTTAPAAAPTTAPAAARRPRLWPPRQRLRRRML